MTLKQSELLSAMSRINNIFHSSNGQNCTPSTSNDPAKASTSNEASAAGFLDGSSNNFLDQLKPKIKEVVQEIISEEEMLVSEVKECDIENALRKLPVVPAVASKLPEPVKNWIKKLIARIEASKPKIPSPESSSETHAIQSEAPRLVSEATPAPPTTNNVPVASE